MIVPSIYGKKRISKEEYDNLPEEEKNKWAFQFLDSDFSPGPGDDVEISFRVAQNGLQIYEADFWVDHHRTCEQFNDKSALCIKGGKTFRKKHNIGIVNPGMWLQAQTFTAEPIEYTKVIDIAVKDKKCLDYGCGGGKDAYVLMEKGGNVDICDITKMNVINSKTRLKELGWKDEAFELALSDEIPVKDNTYDLINCNGVLHHIKEPQLVLREFKRILKNKGELYVMLYTEYLFQVHQKEVLKYMLEQGWTMERAFGEITDKCDYARFYTEQQAKELLESMGFKLVESKLYYNNLFRIFKCISI